MSARNLVIVESPAKAKTIHKYLGPDFEVIASYGHVRDLVNKDGSVLPDENFAMKWQLGDRSEKNVREIKRAVKSAQTLYLAPDPDREGEAIAWHIQEILSDAKLLDGKSVKRVTFNEITKGAVKEAFEHPRELDDRLIEAYLARRALDYLVGFNLSPVLWRKLPGSRSAGRVQSVALRLICEREAEIEKFITEEYWSIEARLHTPEGAPFTARLTHLAGNKLGKMDIGSEGDALKAAERIRSKKLSVQKIEKKQARRFPCRTIHVTNEGAGHAGQTDRKLAVAGVVAFGAGPGHAGSPHRPAMQSGRQRIAARAAVGGRAHHPANRRRGAMDRVLDRRWQSPARTDRSGRQSLGGGAARLVDRTFPRPGQRHHCRPENRFPMDGQ